jgi:hypothetical protein
VNAVPANRPDAAAVPVWWPLEPDDPQCKCKEIDQLSLMLRLGYEDAAALFSGRYDGNLVAMRCRFEAKRPGGCTNGADCDFCHVHPWGKDEVDWSGIVPDPTWGKPDKTRKLHRHERRERREQQGDENAERREYWARLIRGVTQDARLNIHFGKPVGPRGLLHLAVWSVHKLLEEARPTVQYHEDLFDLEPGDVGLWLGVDSLSQNDAHYPLGKAHGVHTLMKGLATRLQRLVQNTSAEYIIIMEGDCRLVEDLQGKLEWLENFVLGHNFIWLAFFTNDSPNFWGRKPDPSKPGFTVEQWPRFKADATGWRHPAYGCQAFCVKKTWIPEWCGRMMALDRPKGLDMWFFSLDHCPDAECKFASRSLGGQEPGQSYSFGHFAWNCGLIEPTPNLEEVWSATSPNGSSASGGTGCGRTT